MRFKTSVSKLKNEDIIIRGESLSSLIQTFSFSDAIFVLLAGRKPNPKESSVFSALLVAIVDHGMGTTSSLTARFVMSGGNSLNTAVGGGILALGDYHGGAIENAMLQLKSLSVDEDSLEEVANQYVQRAIRNKETIFGYGHKVYKERDPRTVTLLSLCHTLDYRSLYIDLANYIETALAKEKGRMICLNIDGFIAAVLLAMGFPPALGKGIFIIGRAPGLVAQAIEEHDNEKPVRRLDESEIEYLPDVKSQTS
ncbi:MAG: citryl-CoA lyase [Acidobacteriota bacterium]|nr:citryl-CoA lyase [Acidobacteriota bacterium]